jgi:DNA-binding transcriptional ArsR family regulator
MPCPLSTEELKYGGGPMSFDEQNWFWLQQIESLQQSIANPVVSVSYSSHGPIGMSRTLQGQQNREAVLDEIRNGPITTTMLARVMDMTDTGVRKHLDALRDDGLIAQDKPRGEWSVI